MKLKLILVTAFITSLFGCTKNKPVEKDTTSIMMMDSLYKEDKTIVIVQKQDVITLGEEFKNFEDNPVISSADLDAINHIETKNIQYIKKGDKIILSEKQEGKR
jgi:hypothetical protein